VNVLIIGGTIFLGRALVEAALARGHDVTTFNRGRHTVDRHVDTIEMIRGDRNSDVTTLQGRCWDAVIDTCGYVPSGIRRVMSAIDRGRVGHYTFVSSISAYADFPEDGFDETAPVATITPAKLAEAEAMSTGPRATARTYGDMYGALKVLCEQAAEEAMPGRVLSVRPGLIVGAHDYSDRFTYWVRRVAHGGDVLAPGNPARRVRVIDVRDLAEWMIRMAESRQTGLFNASGAEDGLTMAGMLNACRQVSGSHVRLIWTDDKFLRDEGVVPWSEMPLWIPKHNGIFEARNQRAMAAGLTFRPIVDTVSDTLQWDRTRPCETPLAAGLSMERERRLLDLYGATDSAR
jgi:nucleoside-diphosphate-sugar epimerase